jgi:hypothetical protein
MKKNLLIVMVCLASLALLAGGANAATASCVDPAGTGTHTSLQAALTDAQANGADDIIYVAQGTYTGHFSYSSAQGYHIALEGGYTPGTNCASRVLNPANTILDGTHTGRVLNLYNSSGGDISVDGFTIRNGSTAEVAGEFGGGVKAYSFSAAGTAGTISITHNIIQQNSAYVHGGGVHAMSHSNSASAGQVIASDNTIQGNTGTTGSGGGIAAVSFSGSSTANTVTVVNNIVTGNSAKYGGGVYTSSYTATGTSGTAILTNNTVTHNTATSPEEDGVPDGGGVWVAYGISGTVNVYNNIIWGNTAQDGGDLSLYLYEGVGVTNGYNNDYTNMTGIVSWNNSGDNINADPLFVGGGDFHLRAASPCIDTGFNSAPGIPSQDFEGNSRIIDGDYDTVAFADIGADEFVPIYLILHKDGAFWSSAGGWGLATPPYYPGTAYAKALVRAAKSYTFLHTDGALWNSSTGWTTSAPPYYPGTNYAVDAAYTDDGYTMILHRDGAIWSSDSGWILTTPPYYPGTAYAKALEVRTNASYAVLHRDGAIYDSASGWVATSPPYYPGTNFAVDMKLDGSGSGYVILHKDGAIWRSSSGWIVTAPPYYPGTDYARALELVGTNGTYVILHKDGAIYNSAEGWVMTAPPYYPGTAYAVDLEVH